MKNFKSQFNFAKNNGFSGSEESYIRNQYEGYATICARCDIDPMTYSQWLSHD